VKIEGLFIADTGIDADQRESRSTGYIDPSNVILSPTFQPNLSASLMPEIAAERWLIQACRPAASTLISGYISKILSWSMAKLAKKFFGSRYMPPNQSIAATKSTCGRRSIFCGRIRHSLLERSQAAHHNTPGGFGSRVRSAQFDYERPQEYHEEQ